MNKKNFSLFFPIFILIIFLLILHFNDTSIIFGENNYNYYASVNSTPSIKDFTLLIYMIGSDLESSLESEKYGATRDIKEMMLASHNSDNLNIVLETGGSKGKIDIDKGGERFIDFNKVQRHLISNNTRTSYSDPNITRQNMGDPNTLSDFINWGISKFPAKKYGIILWDHGASLNGFGKDDNFNSDTLDMWELHKAFKYNNLIQGADNPQIKFEFVGFDACLMASLETADKLKNISKYLIASEEIEPDWGWDYKAVINDLKEKPSQNGSQIGKLIVDSYVETSKNQSKINYGLDKGITLSVIDLSKINTLKEEIIDLLLKLRKENFDREIFEKYIKSIDISESYGVDAKSSYGIIDIHDFLFNLNNVFPSLTNEISSIKKLIKDDIVTYNYSGSAKPRSSGLSFYLPIDGLEFSEKAVVNSFDVTMVASIYHNYMYLMNNLQSPMIKSTKNNNGSISVQISGPPIKNGYTEILTNSSSTGTITRYLNSINTNLINNNEIYTYKKNNMFSLCNESKCIPVSFKSDYYGDREIAYLPVKINQTSNNKTDYTLIFEKKDEYTNFIFLGMINDHEPFAPMPKSDTTLSEGDHIYPLSFGVKSSPIFNKDIFSDPFSDISDFIKEGPLIVNDSSKLKIKKFHIDKYSISFHFCDYKNICSSSRWYAFDSLAKSTNYDKDNVITNYIAKSQNQAKKYLDNLTNLYINNKIGFSLKYPSNWVLHTQDINEYNSRFYEDVNDPSILNLYPISEYSAITDNDIGLTLRFSEGGPGVSMNDILIKRSYKTNLESIWGEYQIISNKKTEINNHPASIYIFTVLKENITESFNENDYIHIPSPGVRYVKSVTIFDKDRTWQFAFETDKEKFDQYVPLIDRIINSFNSFNSKENNSYYFISEEAENKRFHSWIENYSNTITQKLQYYPPKLNFSIYIDEKYGFKIKYPYLEHITPTILTKDQYIVTFSSPSLNYEMNRDYHEPYFSIKVIDPKTDKDHIPYVDYLTNQSILLKDFVISDNDIKTNMINYKLINIEQKQFDKINGYVVENSYLSPLLLKDFYEKNIYLNHNNKIYIITLICMIDDYLKIQPVLNYMVNSLEFKN